MLEHRDFSARIGNVFIPIAQDVALGDAAATPAALQLDPGQGVTSSGVGSTTVPSPIPNPTIKICRTTLKEGCYRINFVPKSTTVFGPRYRGTLRIEHISAGAIRFSGDFYSYHLPIVVGTPASFVPASRVDRLQQAGGAAGGVIPIYSRRSYYSYLKGTKATLTTIAPVILPCWFSLDFDEFRYQHPATGFSGTFPAAPTRSLQFRLNYTLTPDSYTGTVLQGTTELGAISMQWVSPSFRRANLAIYRLTGAQNPPASVPALGGVGTEDFRSVFATVGWDLSFSFAGDIPLPPSLVGVQDPHQCWSQANCATLMASIPGYNAADLDTYWRAYLMAIPARIGCSRGQMFDLGSGDPDNVAREGAVTHSDDGYPSADSTHFGAAEGQMQRDVPRAFVRSASHEVGHTFNQIHQEFEGGSDNSIMTTTPSVADVLFAQGKTFPNDINLGFNSTVRHHLIHLPDPAVRPGAMSFFGAAVNAPQADAIYWAPELSLQITVEQPQIGLGEPLAVSWTLTNGGTASVLAPRDLDIESLTARVSATNPTGQTTFMRPAEQHACVHNPLQELAPGETLTGSTSVFWGRDGFIFERPGRHILDVIVMWQVGELWMGSSAETEVWVSFPASEQDDRVAALLLHPDVGRAIASANSEPSPHAVQRLNEAATVHGTHRALSRLRTLGVHQRLNLP
jgi:hypothetical protein